MQTSEGVLSWKLTEQSLQRRPNQSLCKSERRAECCQRTSTAGQQSSDSIDSTTGNPRKTSLRTSRSGEMPQESKLLCVVAKTQPANRGCGGKVSNLCSIQIPTSPTSHSLSFLNVLGKKWEQTCLNGRNLRIS